MDERNKETALAIIKLESQLQQVSEQVKAQIAFYNKTKADIETLKQELKENTTGRIKESLTLGDNKLDISISDVNRIVVSEPEKVPDEFTTTVQVDNVFQAPNGKYYQKVPNPKLADSFVKAGADVPPGFEAKSSRRISIKFNGETL